MSTRNDVFGESARTYDAWFDTPVGEWADQYEKEVNFRRLAQQPGERVLDIGAGTGRYAVEASKHGAIVKGIDVSEEMLRISRKLTEVASTPVRKFLQEVKARIIERSNRRT